MLTPRLLWKVRGILGAHCGWDTRTLPCGQLACLRWGPPSWASLPSALVLPAVRCGRKSHTVAAISGKCAGGSVSHCCSRLSRHWSKRSCSCWRRVAHSVCLHASPRTRSSQLLAWEPLRMAGCSDALLLRREGHLWDVRHTACFPFVHSSVAQ